MKYLLDTCLVSELIDKQPVVHQINQRSTPPKTESIDDRVNLGRSDA